MNKLTKKKKKKKKDLTGKKKWNSKWMSKERKN